MNLESSSITTGLHPTKVIGLGAGGHGRVVTDIVQRMGRYEIVGIIDRDPAQLGRSVEGVPVIGNEERLAELFEAGIRHIYIGVGGVGDNTVRAQLFARVKLMGFSAVTAVHPRAVLAGSASLGEGSVVMAGVVINPGAKIGANAILNTGCIVDHDCVIGDHVHIAPGVTLSGNVWVGDYSHVGTGATVRQGIRIGRHTVIGAGAVVVKELPDNVTAIGVPAEVIRTSSGTAAK